jgi:O-antigen biosynthesis protein WbqP
MPDIFAQTTTENASIGRTPSAAGIFCKRVTDLAVSVTSLIIFSPLMLLISCAIKIDSPGPALFRQRRVGLNGEHFEIYKFRTMFRDTPDVPTDQMIKLPSPVTRVGRLLRKTSLDELPQLINVLTGEMSLVGPRPALYNQAELTDLRKAHGVLKFPPGITGWAQINGRDELPDDVKVALDTWYCEHWTYWLDWKIVFLTFWAVLSRRGAF